MTTDFNSMELHPLGAFAPESGDSPWTGDELVREPTLAPEMRERVADYLAGCPIFLAWMEYTRDVLEDRFGVSGGAAIVSDGVFYWRLDAAEYVREYGIAVPQDALDHFEEVDWTPPTFSREEYLAIYRRVDAMLGGGEVVG